MISAKVKAIYTTDMDVLEEYIPYNADRFCVFVRVMAGPLQGRGEEAFDVRVCNPKWLEAELERDGFILCMHTVIVSEYDPDQIRRILTKLFERYSGNSWRDVALKLARIGHWEFEE